VEHKRSVIAIRIGTALLVDVCALVRARRVCLAEFAIDRHGSVDAVELEKPVDLIKKIESNPKSKAGESKTRE